MSTWLYQLNQKDWPPATFRYEIWENERWHWTYGEKRGDDPIRVGDVVVFFYAPASGNAPGIYAWAVVERWDEQSKTIYFIPTAPTNHLKMDPWWDGNAQSVVDEIRGNMKQATLFFVTDNAACKVRQGIKRWLSGQE